MIKQCNLSVALILSLLIAIVPACNNADPDPVPALQAGKPEVIYHVFQRSFYDSDGDEHGDLNGLREKLDYLQDLGVTSILMVPLYESVYYHNYFSSDFKKIDPKYGTIDDYLQLVKEIHRRGMKIYMDMETQYVTEDHPWYKDSYKNPSSPYSDYILYQDSAHTQPSTIVMDLTGLKGYDGVTRKITTVNLRSKNVLEYNYDLFKYWTDPNNDGQFDDGVDGFRLDHMMDNLDKKPELKDLFRDFWTPLITRLKEVNPKLSFVAEQAEWGSFAFEYFDQGNVDRVFAFRLAFAIRNFNKNEINSMADTLLGLTPANKGQLVFIENHDMPRFAAVVQNNLPKEKAGAALNILLGGIPTIYYGQEIGMISPVKAPHFGMTDANEIPMREAFEWYAADTGKGVATWYKNSGPWWDNRNNKPGDGISLEEQKDDLGSLWNYYKTLISLRETNDAIGYGRYQTLLNNSDSVVSFLRYTQDKAAVVAVNLSGGSREIAINTDKAAVKLEGKTFRNLLGGAEAVSSGSQVTVTLPAHSAQVFE